MPRGGRADATPRRLDPSCNGSMRSPQTVLPPSTRARHAAAASRQDAAVDDRGAPRRQAPELLTTGRYREAMRRRNGVTPVTDAPSSAERRSWLLLPMSAALIALAVVAGAAVAAPWRMATPDAPQYGSATPAATPQQAVPTETPSPTEQGDATEPVSFVVVLLVIAGILLLAYALRVLLRRAPASRSRSAASSEPARGTAATAPAVDEELDVPALRRGVAAATSVLAEHDEPADAIIAAWLELEAAAASSGVVRAPSATPTEFTTRVLGATRADPDATRTLLRLYLRARFGQSARPTPADLELARRCLERIAAAWADR